MNFLIQLKTSLIVFVLFNCSSTYAQLEFTQHTRLLFVGADSIEGKKIISGVYLNPIDSFHLDVQLDILNDWILKDSIHFKVEIDTSSISSNIYTIENNGKMFPSYRFLNNEGFELYIEKEHQFSYTPMNSSTEVIGFQSNLVKIVLPKKNNFYVKHLPVMFNK